MKNFRRLMTLAFVAVTAAGAQQISASSVAQGATKSPSTVAVTLDLDNAPIATALDEIARQSGARIWYSRSRVNGRVTLKGANISVADALEQVLRNTRLEGRRAADGSWTVSERKISTGVANGVITGKVTDARTGRALAGANISVGADNKVATSGEDGSYRVSGIATGAVVVAVRMVGYSKQSKSIRVADGQAVTVDFKMTPSANVLDQVIVTGTIVQTELKAVPSAITVITAKQIEQRGITRIDQLFRGEVPGLFSLELGATSPDLGGEPTLDEVQMYSRGGTRLTNDNTNVIKTYVDGVEMADSKYLSQIDPRSIERIEILTGPQASTIYGANAINGVMQIFTKRGNSAKPSITFGFLEGVLQNNFSKALAPSHTADGSIAGLEGKLSYNVGASWDYTGAWTPAKQTQRTSVYGGTKYQTGKFSLDLSARQGWTDNRVNGAANQVQTELVANGSYSRIASGISGLFTPTKRSLVGKTAGAVFGYAPAAWWSHQLTLGSDVSKPETARLAAGFASRIDTLIFGNTQDNNVRTSQSYSSTLRIPIASILQATLTYGADHWRQRLTSMTWDVTTSGATANPSVTRGQPHKNTGAFVQGQFGLWDALFFTYGVRADWNPNYGEEAKVRPGRYGVSYSRELGLLTAKIRGSYGRSIRPPSDGQIQGRYVIDAFKPVFGATTYATLPNPELGPEFQQGGEGGLEMYFGNRGSLVVTRYNQTVDGLINSVTRGVDSARALLPGTFGISGCGAPEDLRADGYCYSQQAKYLNIGSIRNQGWELQGSVNMGPFTTSGTYSWTKSRVIGITEKYRAYLTDEAFRPGQTFNYVPEHTWATNIAYARHGGTVALNFSGAGQTLRRMLFGDIHMYANSFVRLRGQEAVRIDLPNYRQGYAGYAITNLTASQRISSQLDVRLQISNIGNYYQNDIAYYVPALGRQSSAGIRWRW